MPFNPDAPTDASRRRFLQKSVLAGLGAAIVAAPCATSAFAAAPLPVSRVRAGMETRAVDLYNANTRETISTVFYAGGRYDKRSFNQLCAFLRDSHENMMHWIDPRLLTLVSDMQSIFGQRQVEVISGYRTPRTNALLAHTTPGVAKDSFHMRGQAIDIRIAGIPTHALRDVAKILNVGGVGYYPQAHFVHVDTGPVRTW